MNSYPEYSNNKLNLSESSEAEKNGSSDVSLRKKKPLGDLRAKSLEMYKSINALMSMKKDTTDIDQNIPLEDVEGFVLGFLYHDFSRNGFRTFN